MIKVETSKKIENSGVTITADFKDDDGSVICRYKIRVSEETSTAARAIKFDLADHIEQFLREEAKAPWMKKDKSKTD